MDKITVVDFGCQYTHQIAERVREAGVYSEIASHDVPFHMLASSKGLILSGGPESVYKDGSLRCDEGIFRGGIPLLGICYGLQLMAHELGGRVGNAGTGEYGEGRIRIVKQSPIFEGLDKEGIAWMSHGDSVLELPPGFDVIAYSDKNIVAAMADEERRIYALQFHPEVSHTPGGGKIIGNFALAVCGANPEWSTEGYVNRAIEQIRRQVGYGRAYVFVSGGVDSSVAAILGYRALGDRVTAFHIDNGLERKGEADYVRSILQAAGIEVQVLDREKPTLRRLGNTIHPERKRNIIGDAFIEALYQEITGFERDDGTYLIQGTIYPDSIESGEGVGRSAAVIKTHHNVGSDKVRALKERGRIVEPNILLFKHETREVARLLGLPLSISERHPFPGPGLGVRCVGYVLKPDEKTNEGVSRILHEYGLDGVVAPVGNVGVKGSGRAYGRVVLINDDERNYETIRRASNRLGNELPGVTRAALFLDGTCYSQCQWDDIRRMPITSGRLDMLREADNIAMENLVRYDLYDKISQMPVVLFPGPDRTPWVALRPVITPDFMTLRPPEIPIEMTWEYLDTTTSEIMRAVPVGGVVFDTTDKPPATTEWE